jgi:hypothetical protein
VLTSELTAKELFTKTQPVLFNPVRRQFYIDRSELPENCFFAGESALSKKSMIGAPPVEVYGVAKTRKFVSQTTQLIDNAKQCQIELWRYDPTILSGEQCADPLSLALSLAHLNDERVELAVEEVLERVWN